MFGKLSKICKWLYRRCATYIFISIYCSLLLIALFNYNPRCKYGMPKFYENDQPTNGKCYVDTSTLGKNAQLNFNSFHEMFSLTFCY